MTTSTPALTKTKPTEKTIVSKQLLKRPVAPTRTTPKPITTTGKPEWMKLLESPPAILRRYDGGNTKNDEGIMTEEEEPVEPVVFGDYDEVKWLDNGVAVVTGEGESWTDNNGQLFAPLLAPDDEVYGCPTFDTEVFIHSSWPQGFNGMVEFPRLNNTLRGGWISCIEFSHDLADIDASNVDIFFLNNEKNKVCFKPKAYNAILWANQVCFK